MVQLLQDRQESGQIQGSTSAPCVVGIARLEPRERSHGLRVPCMAPACLSVPNPFDCCSLYKVGTATGRFERA